LRRRSALAQQEERSAAASRVSTLSRWPATIAVAAGIIALSHLPPSDLPHVPLFPHADKVVHLIEYMTLGLLLFRSLRYDLSGNSIWAAIIAVPAGTLFGALDEWHQGFVGRTTDVWDLAADVAGLSLGILAWLLLNRLRRGDATDGE
jgi:VanZ family protein